MQRPDLRRVEEPDHLRVIVARHDRNQRIAVHTSGRGDLALASQREALQVRR